MAKNLNCLLLFPVKQEEKDQLIKEYPDISFTFDTRETVTTEQVHKADVIMGNPRLEQLAGANRLRWLQLRSAGADEYAACQHLGREVALTNGRGAYGSRLAEYMLAGILSLQKHFPTYWEHQKNHLWKKEGLVRQIAGSTVLVMGVGDIGGTFASYCRAMGAYTIGVRRNASLPCDATNETHAMADLPQLLGRADIVALCLPNTPQTARVLTREMLGHMKDDAILVNVGRGVAIDTEALCDVMEQGKLYGAVLDVTEEEPLPANHRLWSLPNVILTPHIAGTFDQKEGYSGFFQLAKRNLENYLADKPLENVVDRERLY